MALANIGDEDRSTMEPNKKELVKLSEKMITHQINLLEEDQVKGLKWINENFIKLLNIRYIVENYLSTIYIERSLRMKK